MEPQYEYREKAERHNPSRNHTPHGVIRGADWTLSSHPLADLFPMPSEEDLRALARDIRESGLRNSITLYEGKILDGRSRYRACEIAGVVPSVTQYCGDNPLAFVISQNLHRRHLTESQRAMVAARLADLQRGANQHTPEGLPIGRAAKLLNVSERSTARGKEVFRKGSPALVEDVTAGKVTVSAAANSLRPTTSKQKPSDAVTQSEVEGKDTKAPVIASPVSAASGLPSVGNDECLTFPPSLDRRDPEHVFASLKAAWVNTPGLVAAWQDAPLVVRERFITEVLRDPRQSADDKQL